MGVLLYLALQDSRSGGFVEASGLEDMCGVDPIIMATAHYMLLEIDAKLKLPYWNLQQPSACG